MNKFSAGINDKWFLLNTKSGTVTKSSHNSDNHFPALSSSLMLHGFVIAIKIYSQLYCKAMVCDWLLQCCVLLSYICICLWCVGNSERKQLLPCYYQYFLFSILHWYWILFKSFIMNGVFVWAIWKYYVVYRNSTHDCIWLGCVICVFVYSFISFYIVQHEANIWWYGILNIIYVI